MQRALIIGGNRFVGAALAARLKRSGCHVTLVNRHGSGVADRIIKANRNDVAALAPQLDREGWEVVFDTAAYGTQDCKTAVELFGTRTKRYVVLSSIAVYRLGKNLEETDFDAPSYEIPDETKRRLSYGEGKKAVECLFSKNAPFSVVSVRFPFLLGPDDYSKRLEFHVEQNKAGKEIFFCNPNATTNYLQSDEAAEFLERIARTAFSGPINYASAEAFSYRDLMTVIASVTKREARFATKQSSFNNSPYELGSDKTMSLSKARELVFEPSSVRSWLPQLVEKLALS
jgi:nucleoside-diphosphate-sugar epimerase